MARTFLRQDTQIRQSDVYDDTVAAGSTMESAPTNIEDDLNNLRSQVKRVLGETNWYDTLSGRDIATLSTDLADIEGKRVICAVEVLQNVTVPAATYATGSLQAILKANIVDGESFTLNDGVNATVTFEFDTNASVVETAVLRQVDISGDTTAIEVATRMVTAINNAPSLNWSADNASGTVSLVTITDTWGGSHANGTKITEAVADAGFTLVQPTGGAGNSVTLSVAGSEAPSQTAAVGAGTALGAIVAVLSGDVGSHSLVEVSGTNATVPKNRCLVRDWQTRDGLSDTKGSGGMIYALIQAESGTVDGDTFNDSDKQVQLSFVIIDANTDDLVPAAAADIGGHVIEYIYPRRGTIDTLPEDCGFPFFAFTDGSASVSVTLNNAIDNQGITPATQVTDIDIDMTGAGVEWHWRDANSLDLFGILEGSGTSDSEVHVGADTDLFNVDAVATDFANGISVDTGGTEISIGETAGHVESAGILELHSGAGANVVIQAAGEISFIDTNKGGSTYTGNLLLADTSAEWDNYETRFGEVSLLNAIVQAYDAVGAVQKTHSVVNVATVSADTDVGGVGGGANLDAQIHDLSGGTFITDHDVYLNGQLLRGGVDAAANNDYYPGTSLANGQLKFEFVLKINDVICVVSRE